MRINGSALESIFSVLKYGSGGNLSAISYGSSLGKLINRKDQARNRYSEKGYRDVVLNIDGQSLSNNLEIKCKRLSNCHCRFEFPASVSQSRVGGREGSNACTIIAVKFGAYSQDNNLDISLLWNQLPNIWIDCFVNAVCDGNYYYDQLFSDTAVFLDVDDVVNSLGQECQVNSANQIFGFNNANNFNDLIIHIESTASSSRTDNYGVIIASERSVGLLVKPNGLCALIDSHMHMSGTSGGCIVMSTNPKAVIIEYSNILKRDSITLNVGVLTWIKYNNS